jgi:hypothetical protein
MDGRVLVHKITHLEVITEDQAAEVVAVIKRLTGGEPTVAVVDIRSVGYALPEARHAFAAGPEDAGEVATALIVANSASRAMARVFLALSKPARPVKVFTNTEAALTWAREFQPEE